MSREPRSESVVFRVSPEELEMIRRAAQRHSMSVSDYCRACVHTDMIGDLDPKAIGHVIGLLAEKIAGRVRSKERARGRAFPAAE